MTNMTEAQPSSGTPWGRLPVSPGNYDFQKTGGAKIRVDDALADVLFEQLDYLIQFSDCEQDRLDRVAAILLEAFM